MTVLLLASITSSVGQLKDTTTCRCDHQTQTFQTSFHDSKVNSSHIWWGFHFVFVFFLFLSTLLQYCYSFKRGTTETNLFKSQNFYFFFFEKGEKSTFSGKVVDGRWRGNKNETWEAETFKYSCWKVTQRDHEPVSFFYSANRGFDFSLDSLGENTFAKVGRKYRLCFIQFLIHPSKFWPAAVVFK